MVGGPEMAPHIPRSRGAAPGEGVARLDQPCSPSTRCTC